MGPVQKNQTSSGDAPAADRPRPLLWAFSRPDLQNLSLLFAQATGQPLDLPERLKRERQRKAKAIAAHQAMWDEVVRKMVMALDAGEIEGLEDVVDGAMDRIRGVIEATRKR